MKITVLVKVITDQAFFMKDTTPENVNKLYDEVSNFLNENFKGYEFIKTCYKPENIKRSENFQYVSQGNKVSVINKYFK